MTFYQISFYIFFSTFRSQMLNKLHITQQQQHHQQQQQQQHQNQLNRNNTSNTNNTSRISSGNRSHERMVATGCKTGKL